MSNGTFNIPGYNSFSGCDMIVTARLTKVEGYKIHEKTYSLGSLQTLSISTHQDKRPVRAIGNMNAIDYTMGQRTIAGSMVFAVFDRHFASAIFDDLKEIKGSSIILADELPPLDITITFANEYGRTSRMAVYGVRLINEGQVMSINDVYTENTYQFVANALEPLNKGETNGSKSSNKSKTVITTASSYSRGVDTTGEEIANFVYNNNIDVTNQDIKLTVEVEQPKSDYVLGIAKFQLTPKQVNGHINISNLTSGKITKIYLENISNQGTIYAELEYGKYSATYYGEEDYIYSNTVTFSVEGQRKITTDKNDQPIIEKIGHDAIQITCNNISHTHVEYYLQSKTARSVPKTIELVSKKATLTDLYPNEYYVIKTTDLKQSYSKSTTALTLAYEKQDVDLFINYIIDNQKLLLEDITKYEYILDKIKISTASNIIDAITSIERDNRTQELLLYAIKFQNELNVLFNSSSLTVPTKVLSEPFWDVLKHDEQAVKANYFYMKKRKNYFDLSLSYPTIHTHTGVPNRRYYTYDLLEDGSRGIRCDFCCLTDDVKAELEVYKNVDMVSQLDLSKFRYLYAKSSTQALYEVAARDAKEPNIRILKAPYITYDDKINSIVADIDFTEILGESTKNFYLCISNIHEALDHSPVRKIKFTGKDKTIVLDKYTTGVSPNKTYLAWIENDMYDIISFSSIFKTHSDTIEIENINSQDAQKEYTAIKRALENKVGKKQVLDTVFSYVMSYQNIQKRLYDSLEQEMINYVYNDINADAIIAELLKIKFDRNHYLKDLCKKVVYDKTKRTVSFKTDRLCHIAKIDYIVDETYPIKSTEQIENSIYIDDSKTYTLLYLVESSLMSTSGFILINNVTKEYYSYNLEVEVI